MAGTIQPIAALTADDRGPINTIVSIILCTSTILFTAIRIAVRSHKALNVELDDAVFGVALCFGLTTSVLSHYCVRAGLGRHQDALADDQVEQYFKLFWVTQFTAVIALACAKLSLTFTFRRIDPVQMGASTGRWLIPMIGAFALLAFFLIGFQCQLPHPWILNPDNCSTHGNVYYPITIFNILSDAWLACWIVPLVWDLQMARHTKSVIVSLFMSRIVVCIVDIGRLITIRNALHTEDETRSQLLWAIMDQIVVHLSINHATLPRIHTFLAHLQTGLLDMHVPPSQNNTQISKSRTNPTGHGDNDHLDSPTPTRSGGRERRRPKHTTWNAIRSTLSTKSSKASSISEYPLRLQPEHGIELSTTVYTGDGESTRSILPQNPSNVPPLPREGLPKEDQDKLGGVRVQKEIKMAYDSA